VIAVLHGLSIQARDEATAGELSGMIDAAMATWERFTRARDAVERRTGTPVTP
jgi:hypothetical protein